MNDLTFRITVLYFVAFFLTSDQYIDLVMSERYIYQPSYHTSRTYGWLDGNCPKHCQCQEWNTSGVSEWIVDCSGRSLHRVPERIPTNATRLLLMYNSITALEENAFSELRNLTHLILVKNNISSIHKNSFFGLGNLKILDLSFNDNLKRMQNDTFQYLNSLVDLSMENVSLDGVSAYSFSGLYNLRTLNLASNNISVIHEMAFSNVRHIKYLDLSYNSIEEFKNGTFAFLQSLQVLNLSAVGLNRGLQNNTFIGLNNLFVLKLSFNRISYINPNTFTGLINLKKLYLRYCYIKEILPGSFAPLPSLRVLHLEGGLLNNLTAEIIASVLNLTEFVVSRNQFSSFPTTEYYPINISLHSNAKILFIDKMKLDHFDLSLFRVLEVLDSSDNMIHCLSRKNFSLSVNLRNLSLASNFISTLPSDVFSDLVNLLYLDLSDNSLTVLSQGLFSNLTSLKTLYLQDNKIYEFVTKCYDVLPSLEDLDLSGNRLVKMEALNQNRSALPKLKILRLNNCCIKNLTFIPPGVESIEELELDNNELVIIPDKSFVRFHNLSSLSLEFNVFEVQNNSFKSNSLKSLSLAGSRFYRFPRGASIYAPESLEILNISKSSSQVSGFGEPTYLPNLKRLHARGMQIDTLSGFLFNFSTSLEELDFGNNFLLELNFPLFSTLTNLTKLRMPRNYIANIYPSSLPSNFRKKLTDLVKYQEKLLELDLAENPFECDCDLLWLVKVLRVLYRNRLAIDIHKNFRCNTPPNLKGKSIFENTVGYNDFDCFTNHNIDWILVSIYIVTPVFMLGSLITSGLYRYRWAARYWKYVITSRRRRHQEYHDSLNLPYDAFISYCQNDLKWVRKRLIPRLEAPGPNGEEGLKLCIHHRDWLAGRDIMDNVVYSVQSSRKTVLVVSNSFIKSNWCHLELTMAQSRLYQDERNNLVIILLEALDYRYVNPRLRYEMDQRTYIQWPRRSRLGRKLFWMKLRKALAKPISSSEI